MTPEENIYYPRSTWLRMGVSPWLRGEEWWSEEAGGSVKAGERAAGLRGEVGRELVLGGGDLQQERQIMKKKWRQE